MTKQSHTVENVEEIGKHLVDVRNLFVQLFNRMAKENDAISEIPFSISQMRTLSAFHEDKEYTMSELSKKALVKMPSMTEMVDRLVADGMLERVRDIRDRRVVKVRLTSYGKKMHKQFVATRKNEMNKLFGKLNAKEQTELVKSLKKVSIILNRLAKAAC